MLVPEPNARYYKSNNSVIQRLVLNLVSFLCPSGHVQKCPIVRRSQRSGCIRKGVGDSKVEWDLPGGFIVDLVRQSSPLL